MRHRHQKSRQKNQPRHPHPTQKTFATLQKNAKGFGFLVFDQKEFPDAFIPKGIASRFFDGDRVAVEFGREGAIRNVSLVEHRYKELLGRVDFREGRGGSRATLVVQRRRLALELPLKGDLRGPKGLAKPGDWVQAKVEYQEGRELRVSALVTRVFGETVPPQCDVDIVAGEYGLIEEHSPEAIAEATRASKEDPLLELKQGRQDLRRIPFITIDGVTARDFDDAVFVEKSQNGYMLWVAIADVSHYVRPGTALDAEAYARATSVYFPERAFHMLPQALSEGSCSLKPNVPRLAFVCRMEFDRAGHRLDTELMLAVIESRKRGIYEEVDKDRAGYKEHFELYEILRRMREERGSIDFELPESEIMVDQDGAPTHIERRSRLETHRLIEEFMIAANEAVTEWAIVKKAAFLYRIHEEPAPMSLKDFELFAKTQGLSFELSKGPPSPKKVQGVVDELLGHRAHDLLQSALLRAMKKAIYSDKHAMHFGLASRAYTHFTSPIRRYPDLVVHRLLKGLLAPKKGHTVPAKKHSKDEPSELAVIAKHCSYRERIAQEADWEAQRIKKVRIMATHLGKALQGRIANIKERGFFVQLKDPFVEGFVSVEHLRDDAYQFDEERLMLVGRRTRRRFKVGDDITVIVAAANLERREIDFTLEREPGKLTPGKKRHL